LRHQEYLYGVVCTRFETLLLRLLELSEAGVNYCELSMDHWHLPYISQNRVRDLLWAARRAGIKVMLRTLFTRNHGAEELLASFKDEELMNVIIANGRVQPVGRAASQIPPDEIAYGRGVEGCCENILTLTVAPNGNVYPCCAGADITESLLAVTSTATRWQKRSLRCEPIALSAK
jgi:hypothetical protein